MNTVLASITASVFSQFSDAIEEQKTKRNANTIDMTVVETVAQKALNDSWKVIFNGNGYDSKNQEELTARGVWRIDSGLFLSSAFFVFDVLNILIFFDYFFGQLTGVDAIHRITAGKNVELFEKLQVC